MKISYHLIILTMLLSIKLIGQDKPNPTKELIRTDEAVKSGNYKDVFVKLAQVAYKDFTDGKHFQINSSLSSLISLFDTLSLIDTNYQKHSFARRTNLLFDLNLKNNNNFQIKDATVGFKYAIFNGRDKNLFNAATMFPSSTAYNDEKNRSDAAAYEWIALNRNSLSAPDSAKITNYLIGINGATFEKLPQAFQNYFTQFLKSSHVFKNVPPKKYGSILQAMRDSLLDIVGKKWLVTAAINYKFDPVAHLELEALKAFGNQHSVLSFEFDGKSTFDMIDSVKIDGSYSRQISETSAGLNFVFRRKAKSIVELKVSGAYKYVVSGLQPKEKNNVLTVDGTLRFRITDVVWLPVTFKYDPTNGKVLGFLNMTANF